MTQLTALLLALCALIAAIGHATAQNQGCSFAPPLSPVPSQLPASVQAEIENVKAALLNLFESSGATAGAATIVYDQTQLMTYTYGKTRAGGQGANITGDTVFRIGSNTKVFTDVMLLSLRDAGKISLDTQVTSVVPQYAPKPYPGYARNKRGATFGDLGSHTAGLPREPPCDINNCTSTLADVIAAVNNFTLLYPPGSSVSYSNFGFTLLGRFLEKVAGQSWEDYVAENVFKPLSMQHTSVEPPADLSTVAFGYQDGVAAPLISLGVATPAGGLFSSANDMAKWAMMFLRDEEGYDPANGQLLDGTTIREMFQHRSYSNPSTIPPGSAFPVEWGLPWEVYLVSASTPKLANFSEFYMQTKDGAIGGYLSFLAIVPELKFAMFVVISTGGPTAGNFLQNVPSVIAFDGVPVVYELLKSLAPAQPPLPPNVNDYTGAYSIPSLPSYNATVSVLDGWLVLNGASMYNNQRLKWLGEGDLLQMAGFPSSYPCEYNQGGSADYMLQFMRGSSGAVNGFIIQGFGITNGPDVFSKV